MPSPAKRPLYGCPPVQHGTAGLPWLMWAARTEGMSHSLVTADTYWHYTYVKPLWHNKAPSRDIPWLLTTSYEVAPFTCLRAQLNLTTYCCWSQQFCGKSRVSWARQCRAGGARAQFCPSELAPHLPPWSWPWPARGVSWKWQRMSWTHLAAAGHGGTGATKLNRLREPAREPESTLGTMKWRTNVLNCVWPSTSTSEIRFSRRQLHIIATAHGVSSFPPTTQTHSNAFTLLIHSRTRFQDWNFALRLCTQQSSRLLMAHFQG